MLLQELREPDEALPLGVSALESFRGQRPDPAAELIPEPLTCCLRFGARYGFQHRLRFSLVLLRNGIQHVQDLVVPTPPLSRCRLLLG